MRRNRRGPEIVSNKGWKFGGERKEEKKEVAGGKKSQIKQPETNVDTEEKRSAATEAEGRVTCAQWRVKLFISCD